MWRLIDSNTHTRGARKTLAPLIPSDFMWHGAGEYLFPHPSIKELMEDEEMTRAQAKPEQDRIQALERTGSVLELHDTKFVAETFMHFVAMKWYMLGHWVSFRQSADVLPYLMWDAIDDCLTPPDCKRKDGKIYAVNDRFWQDNPIPCGRAFCRCSIRALSKSEARERLMCKST